MVSNRGVCAGYSLSMVLECLQDGVIWAMVGIVRTKSSVWVPHLGLGERSGPSTDQN